MSPNDGRIEHMMDMVGKYKVDGVAEVVLQACHTFNIEAVRVQRACEQAGVPYMKRETDYSTNDAGQVETRLGAFIEMLLREDSRESGASAAERRCLWRSSIARGRHARCPW